MDVLQQAAAVAAARGAHYNPLAYEEKFMAENPLWNARAALAQRKAEMIVARKAIKDMKQARGKGMVPKRKFYPKIGAFGYGGYSGYGRYKRRFGRRRYGSTFGRRRVARRHGHGGYWGDWLGRKFGNIMGGDANFVNSSGNYGSQLGDRLQGWLGLGAYNRRKFGYGAYYDPSIGATYNHDQEIPVMSNPGGTDGPVVIRHKEYIGDIVSTGSAFNLGYKIAINPALPGSFPWLAALANSFTQYRLQGMIFHFKSTSGALSTTQALGEIIMAVQYDTAAPEFTNKTQMLNEVFSMSKVPSLDAECPVECDPSQTANMGLYYTRNDALASGQDYRFYDVGKFYLATMGQAAAGTLGELWVTYQVALYKPQLPEAYNFDNQYTRMYFNAVDSSHWLGTARTVAYNGLGVTSTNNAITLPIGSAGDFLFCFTWKSDFGNFTFPTQGYTNAIVNPNLIWPSASAINQNTIFYAPQVAGNCALQCSMMILHVVDPTQVATVLLLSGAIGTNAVGSVLITYCPTGII